jgi:ATP:ADP antiporter, AAA family
MRGAIQCDRSLHAAALSAAALIAHQVGGKATRDALFLSHFDVTRLAWMVVASSLLAIAVGVAGARLMSSLSPSRVIPRAFLFNGILLIAEWVLSAWNPAIVAVMFYLQMAALGSVLISGFWALLGEGFDPHTARKQFTRIVGAGTFGGIIGGLIAERMGTALGVTAVLPVLALLDFICAFLTNCLVRTAGEGVYERPRARTKIPHNTTTGAYRGFRLLWSEPYIRDLGLLIVLSTVGAALLDYVFKVRAAAAHHGDADLVRFFAIFYTAVGVITFLVQIVLSRPALEKFGLAGAIGSLPFAAAVGAVGGIILPGLSSATVARSGEAVLRSSMFRSGYELFFAAVPRLQRREIKPVIDVGFERFGDMIGGLLITAILSISSGLAVPAMLTIAALTGLTGLWISRKLHQGYIKALETNLLNQSIHIELSDIRDSTTRGAVMRTLLSPKRTIDANKSTAGPDKRMDMDPIVARITALRSSDPQVVRLALQEALDPSLTSHVITLLAWNAVADDAVQALQKVAPSITGQLVDGLLDPSQEFAVRRRIPRVLSVLDSMRAVDGLAQSLFDSRFEVRFQSGRALAQIQDRTPGMSVDHSLITKAVLQELAVSREVWESRSIIDRGENEISNVSAEHVFRLLSLVLPRDPLKVAYRGLHSGDAYLKGMALEYLDGVLPLEIRQTIWPVLEAA